MSAISSQILTDSYGCIQKMNNRITPFNSPLETGVRALTILNAIFPTALDLQRIVDFDYLVVHSGDAGGPKSLHAPLPLRSGELLVRRGLIENGLMLMMSRGLVSREPTKSGIHYLATEDANPFLESLISSYMIKLKERAVWVAERFQYASNDEVSKTTRSFLNDWTIQFQRVELPAVRNL